MRPLAIVGLLLAGCQGPTSEANFAIIVLDDVGPEKIGVYGHGQPLQTPVIDALAAEGLTFTNAYAHPVCTPGRAALLTGRHGRRTGVARVFKEWETDAVPESEPFLPEVLAPGGYRSALVGKYHLAGANAPHAFQHPKRAAGFDHFAGTFSNLTSISHSDDQGDYFRWEKVTDGRAEMVQHYAVSETIDDAIAQVRDLPEPFLLVVSLQAAHHPWHVPPAKLTHGELSEQPSLGAEFDAMVEAADTEIGRFLDAIPGGRRANTTILLTSDNGTPDVAARAPLSPGRAKGTMYEGGIRVPLIVAGPTVAEPGRTSDQLVQLVDVLPTLVDLADLSLDRWDDRDIAFDGVSLTPVLADSEASSGREYVFSEVLRPGVRDERILRDDRYKLIRRAGAPDELYDLEGRHVEGPDLLRHDLDSEAAEAYERLGDALEDLTEELVAD